MNPQIFLVGGAVRDLILGNSPKDFDYVVVGASPAWMIERGYKQVGAAFPVFLHPESGSEYALARREKKVAPGYLGFDVEFGTDVTLEEDLSRRDLTINSIAMGPGNTYIDPFGGIDDLKNGIIRHTSEAFAEDPLRVMRVARFAARYQFLIHSDTIELCKQIVNNGELDALSADRIWGELVKLFSEAKTSIGLKFLSKIGALHRVDRLKGLVKDVPENYERFHDDIEPKLTSIQKMYLNLNLGTLQKDALEHFRVPTEVVREWKFIDIVFDLCYGSFQVDIDDGNDSEILNKLIVDTFDQFRHEIKSGKVTQVQRFIDSTLKGDFFRVPAKRFFIKLNRAFSDLLNLDFTDLVKGMNKADIKNYVRAKKIEVVTTSMNSPQIDICPFCGEQLSGIGYDGSYNGQPAINMFIMCTCGALGPSTIDGRSANGSWNTEDALTSAITKWNERIK